MTTSVNAVATHNDLVTAPITYSSPTSGARGFSTVMFISSDSTLGGTDRVRSYATAAEVSAALTATTLSASAAAAGLIAFGQPNPPDRFLVGRKASGETWAEAYALCVVDTLGVEAFGICIQSRTDADILAIGAAVEAEGLRLFAAQANNTDLLSGAIASSTLAAMAAYKLTALYYHTTDTQWLDVAHMVDRLSWDPDETSAGWNSAILGVSAYTGTAITQTQKVQARTNNVNLMLPFGTTTDLYVDPGHVLAGLQISEVVTGMWASTRIREAVADLIVAYAARGQKLPVTAVGQAVGNAAVFAILLRGVTAGHFVEDQIAVNDVAINAADLTAARMRYTIVAQNVTSARSLAFPFTLSTAAVL